MHPLSCLYGAPMLDLLKKECVFKMSKIGKMKPIIKQIIILVVVFVIVNIILEEFRIESFYLEENSNKILYLLFFSTSLIISLRFYSEYKMPLVSGLSILLIVMLLIDKTILEILYEFVYDEDKLFDAILITSILWNSIQAYRFVLVARKNKNNLDKKN